MLVLTRRLDESLVIGDTTITVVGIRRGKVVIAIDAPDDVDVYRKELLDRINLEQEAYGDG